MTRKAKYPKLKFTAIKMACDYCNLIIEDDEEILQGCNPERIIHLECFHTLVHRKD